MATTKKVVKKVEDNTPRTCLGKDSKILDCTTARFASDFYKTKNEFTDGYTGYCKNCAHKMYDYYLEQTGNSASAIYYTMQKLDMPFRSKAYTSTINEYMDKNEVAKKEKKTFNYDWLAKYLGYLGWDKSADGKLATTFADSDYDVEGIKDIGAKIKDKETKLKEIEKFKLAWGEQE